MACPPISTGHMFLAGTLDHLDCQAQALGSLGFQSLAAPGAAAHLVLSALLTLFIALWGLRLLTGRHVDGGDIITAFLKIGIVLTLALSWPAYRTVIYDLVLHGPAEVARGLGAGEQLPGSDGGLTQRLQAVDDGIVQLTVLGSGRGKSLVTDMTDSTGAGFKGIALQDEATLGWARVAYLAGTLAPLAALRLAAGLLLGLAPLFAGLLFFDAARGIFAGWLRGLALTALGSLGVTIVLSAELALIEPWMAQALMLRQANYGTPAAPTELLALTGAFALASLLMLAILARIAFHGSVVPSQHRTLASVASDRSRSFSSSPSSRVATAHDSLGRAHVVAEAIARQERHLSGGYDQRVPLLAPTTPGGSPAAGTSGGGNAPVVPLGSGYRRTAQRGSTAARQRDAKS